jgi:gas vesicle protein
MIGKRKNREEQIMNSNQSSIPYVGAFMLGSVIGALAGTLVGMLLAPKAGVETQADIRRRMLELREHADETISRGRESLENSFAGTSGRINETAEKARSRIAEQMESAASSISQQAKHIRPDNKPTAG